MKIGEVKKIDEWKIKGKNAELWRIKDNLQVRCLGTIHNIPLSSVTPKPKSEYEHDRELVKAYNDGQAYILDKVRAEIEALYNTKNYLDGRGATVLDCLKIIDKYRGDTDG